MLRHGFKDAADPGASFGEEDPDVFDLFLEWIYIGGYSQLVNMGHQTEERPFRDRIRLYAFVEKLVIPHLIDYTMTNLMTSYSRHGTYPSRWAINLAYMVTKPGSQLRTFMTYCLRHLFSYQTHEADWPTNIMSELLVNNIDMTRDLITHLRHCQGMVVDHPKRIPACMFHIHHDGPDGKKCICKY